MISTSGLTEQLRGRRPTVHKPGLVASKPVACLLCHPAPGTLAASRTRKLLLLLIGVAHLPGLKRKLASLEGPQLRSPPLQCPFQPPMWTLIFVLSPHAAPHHKPFSLLLRQLCGPRERGRKRPHSADIHIQVLGGFPLPPVLSELQPKPENLFLISCTFAVQRSAL